jgi:hypothetical protein
MSHIREGIGMIKAGHAEVVTGNTLSAQLASARPMRLHNCAFDTLITEYRHRLFDSAYRAVVPILHRIHYGASSRMTTTARDFPHMLIGSNNN